MKATGIVRKIDDLGRVVIPMEIRRNYSWKEGDPLEIYTDRDGEVILKKYDPAGVCLVCGGKEDVKELQGRYICVHCCSEAIGKAVTGESK